MLSLILIVALLRLTFALSPITAKGSKFFNADGSQFYIKGVAYQLTDDDPLANPDQCKLDAALMKELGANAIRVYHVDASADHDSCMSTFDDAGIYTLIDLDTFKTYIIPQDSTTGAPEWTQRQYSAYAAVMDTFHGYHNVLAFFVGNELLTTAQSSVAAPYIKAAARDMKAYRDSKGYRQIPIGYSAADVSILRPNLQNYMACGGNASETVDFYSLNSYEWCGTETSYTISGYDVLEKNATGYPIPIFFSEDGCIKPQPRTFEDQAAILGPEMDSTWSGVIIYEWIQVQNGYGIISYGPPVAPTATATNVEGGFTIGGTPTPISPDFSELQAQWSTLSPSGVSSDAYTPAGTTPVCPPFTASAWSVSGNVPLPTIGEAFSHASQVQQTAKQPSASGSGGGAAAATPSPSASTTGKDSAAASPVTPPGSSVLLMLGAAAVGVLTIALAL